MKYNNHNRFKITLLHGAILAALSGTQLIAADADIDTEAAAKEDNIITVTARKKEESIIEVPMNISTVSEMEISDRNLLNKEELFRSVAGASSPRGQLILRGLSGSNSSAPDTTSTFTDGVPFDFSDLFDVERVEILRGPQGTLYGSNAIGGTVRIITNQPVLDELEVKTSIQVSSENKVDGYDHRLLAAVNVPVADNMALRVTGSKAYDSRAITNVNTGVQAYERDDFLRAQLLWVPEDDLKITFGYVHTSKFEKGTGLGTGRGTNLADLSTGVYSGYEAVLTDNPDAPFGYDVAFDTSSNIDCEAYRVECLSGRSGLDPRYNSWELMDDFYEYRNKMFTLNLVKENIADFASLTYSGSYREYIDERGVNSWSRNDGNDMFRTWLTNNWEYKRVTHEIRLQNIEDDSNVSWTVGYFYDKDYLDKGIQHQWHGDGDKGKAIATYLWGDSWGYLEGGWTDLEGNYQDITNVAELGMFYWNNPDINYSEETLEYYTLEQSFFGELSYTMQTENLGEFEFGAGIRYYDLEDHEKAEIKGIWGSTDDDGVHIVEIRDNGGSESGNRKKFTTSWRPNADMSIYGIYSEGYRPGGNNIALLPQSCRNDPNAVYYQARYESDQIKNKEVGYKASMLGGKFNISSAVYQIDWTGVQAEIRMGCGFGFTANAATARSRGMEIETSSRLTDDLTLTVNLGYTNSKMLEAVKSIDAEAGDDMTQVPEYNYYLALDQGISIFDRTAYIRLDIEGYGEYKSHFKATDEDIISAYEKVNLSTRIDINDKLNMSLHINNLFDKEIIDYRITTGGGYGNFHDVLFAPGRNVTFKVDYIF